MANTLATYGTVGVRPPCCGDYYCLDLAYVSVMSDNWVMTVDVMCRSELRIRNGLKPFSINASTDNLAMTMGPWWTWVELIHCMLTHWPFPQFVYPFKKILVLSFREMILISQLGCNGTENSLNECSGNVCPWTRVAATADFVLSIACYVSSRDVDASGDCFPLSGQWHLQVDS